MSFQYQKVTINEGEFMQQVLCENIDSKVHFIADFRGRYSRIK